MAFGEPFSNAHAVPTRYGIRREIALFFGAFDASACPGALRAAPGRLSETERTAVRHAACPIPGIARARSAAHCLLIPRTAMPDQIVAGVDLGSNSFHMIVARVDEGQL